MDDKLLEELHNIDLYLGTFPDLVKRKEAINQRFVELNERLYQQFGKRRKKWRDVDRKNVEHVAKDQLIHMFVRFQNMLHWLSSSELLIDVLNMNISCFSKPTLQNVMFLYLHVAIKQNLLIVLASKLLTILIMKLQTIKHNASSKVMSTLDGTISGVRGKRSDRDRDQSRDNLRNNFVFGASWTSLDGSTDDRETKTKPKQKNNHLSTSRNLPLKLLQIDASGVKRGRHSVNLKLPIWTFKYDNGLSMSKIKREYIMFRPSEPSLPARGSSQPLANAGNVTEREVRLSSCSNIHRNASKEADEAIDFRNSQLNELDTIMEESGVSNDLGGLQDLSSWLNIDEDHGLQHHGFIGLEMPIDDLSDLKFAF
ncbi:hypothetical protein QQP08_025927 [Theobroma cacao]|nr:hypothetical protein QQP08_025927 [Theobroma cacao]